MANRETHIKFAMLIFLAVIFILYFLKKTDLMIYIVAPLAFGLGLGAIMPDILNPPYHWTHRKGAHSKGLLKSLVYALLITALVSIPISFFINWVWIVPSFIIGYISHLFLDSLTPMGLPI